MSKTMASARADYVKYSQMSESAYVESLSSAETVPELLVAAVVSAPSAVCGSHRLCRPPKLGAE